MKKYFLLIVFLCSSVFSLTSVAKTINLYEAPKDNNNKVIGTADSEAGIIPIFTPQGSSWIKIADPRNGNVGWAKSSDLSDAKINVTMIRTGNRGCEINQHIGTYSSQDMQKIMKQSFERAQAVQKQIEKNMQENMQKLWGK